MPGKLKEINLTGKCGSCEDFKRKAGTRCGYCLKQKYDPEIAPEKEIPYALVQQSKRKCRYYKKVEQKRCDTCDWYEDFQGVCFNGESEHCADFISGSHSCPCWEPKKEAEG